MNNDSIGELIDRSHQMLAGGELLTSGGDIAAVSGTWSGGHDGGYRVSDASQSIQTRSFKIHLPVPCGLEWLQITTRYACRI